MHNLYQQHVAPTWENSFTDFRLFYCLQSVLERASGFRGNSAELSANTDLGERPKCSFLHIYLTRIPNI